MLLLDNLSRNSCICDQNKEQHSDVPNRVADEAGVTIEDTVMFPIPLSLLNRKKHTVVRNYNSLVLF